MSGLGRSRLSPLQRKTLARTLARQLAEERQKFGVMGDLTRYQIRQMGLPSLTRYLSTFARKVRKERRQIYMNMPISIMRDWARGDDEFRATYTPAEQREINRINT